MSERGPKKSAIVVRRFLPRAILVSTQYPAILYIEDLLAARLCVHEHGGYEGENTSQVRDKRNIRSITGLRI